MNKKRNDKGITSEKFLYSLCGVIIGVLIGVDLAIGNFAPFGFLYVGAVTFVSFLANIVPTLVSIYTNANELDKGLLVGTFIGATVMFGFWMASEHKNYSE